MRERERLCCVLPWGTHTNVCLGADLERKRMWVLAVVITTAVAYAGWKILTLELPEEM